MRTGASAVRSAAIVLCAAFALVLTFAGPAGAHALLQSAQPASDAIVQVPPRQIVLTFDESVEAAPDGIRVLDPSGDPVDDVVASTDGVQLRAALPALERDGSYTVDWSAVSADGHPVRGAYLFHLRERTLVAPTGSLESGTPLYATLARALGAVVAIGGLVAVFAAGAGGAVGGRAVDAGGARAGVRRRRWAVVVTGTLLAGLGAVAAVGEPFVSSVRVAVNTMSGSVALVAIVVASAGTVVSGVRGARARELELALAAATTVAVAAQGHAVSIAPVVRSAGLTVVHVAAAVAWAVALVVVDRASVSTEPSRLGGLVRRWSPWLMGAVALVAVSGSLLVLDRVGLDRLTTSTYGRVALIKSALLIVALGLAARNRWRLAPQLVEPGDEPGAVATHEAAAAAPAVVPAVARLRASVRAEIIVLALALVVGAVLAQVAPPADGSVPAGGPFSQRATFGQGQVELTVDPGRRGTNEMHVTAIGADGRLMDGIDDLTLSLTLPADDVGPLTPQMQRVTTGHSVSYGEFPLAGEWTVEVTAHPSKFEELRATFVVPIGG